jgi:hypothetical protein
MRRGSRVVANAEPDSRDCVLPLCGPLRAGTVGAVTTGADVLGGGIVDSVAGCSTDDTAGCAATASVLDGAV